MKKFFAALLAMIMVLSLVPATIFAAEATCPGVGKEHNKNNCASYSEVKVVEAGAAGEYGYTIYECNDCHEQFVADFVEGADCAHVSDEGVVTTEPDCDTKGVKTYTCTLCEKVIKTEDIPALGHKYETIDGIGCAEKQVCTVCGDEKAAGEHTWGLYPSAVLEEPYFDADGIAHDGLAEYTCEVCGDVKHVIIICEHEHKVTKIAGSAADCLNTGKKDVYECSVCKKLFADEAATILTTADDAVIPALGHDWSEPTVVPGSCVEYYVCEREGCGATKATEGDEINHTNFEHILSVENTCTQYGFELWGCTNCGMTEVKSVTAPANHKTQETVVVPGTCTYPGYTFTYCAEKNCDVYVAVSTVTEGEGLYRIDGEGKDYFNGYDVTVDGEAVKLISIADTAIVTGYHDYVADENDLDGDGDVEELVPGNTVYTVVQEPKCYVSGIGVWSCVLCGYNKAQTEAAAHAWGEWVETAPSCETAGVKVRSCTECGKTESATIPATDHVYKDIFHRYTCIDTAEDDGLVWVERINYTCQVCGDKYYDYVTLEESGLYTNNYFTSMEEAEAVHGTWVIAHTYELKDGEWVEASETVHVEPTHNIEALPSTDPAYVHNESTCTEHGYQSYICNDCGLKFFIELPYANHNIETSEKVDAEANTCYEDGVKEHYICGDCGATHIDGVTVDAADLVIPAAHGKTEIISARPAGCDEVDYDAFAEAIEALDENATPKDLVDIYLSYGFGLGSDIAYCTECGSIFNVWEGVVDTTWTIHPMQLWWITPGHDLVTYEGTAPTCQTEGTLSYEYCAKGCGHAVSSGFFGANGVVLVDSVEVDEDGNIVIVPAVLPALGHSNVSLTSSWDEIITIDGTMFVVTTITVDSADTAIVEVDANNPACLCNAIGHHSCTKITYAHYMCTLCEKEWINNYAPAEEKHLTEDGKELSCNDKCAKCGYTSADHVWTDTHIDVEPTCVDYGYSYIYCTVCGEQKVSNITPAVKENHKWTETDGVKECELCGEVVKSTDLVVTVTPNAETACDGSKFVVTISVDAADVNVWGMSYELAYNTDLLEYVSATLVTENFTEAGAVNAKDGIVYVGVNGTKEGVVVSEEQAIVEITFKVKNAAAASITDFAITAEATNKDGEDVVCKTNVDQVKLVKFLDLDGDGKSATLADAYALYSMMGLSYAVEADADGNGKIELSDLFDLYNVMVRETTIEELLARNAE